MVVRAYSGLMSRIRMINDAYITVKKIWKKSEPDNLMDKWNRL